MRPRDSIYVNSSAEYDKHKQVLKHVPCPKCGVRGCLIRHGYLRGYGDRCAEKIQRGWRVFCSNRGLKQGCGKTYSILLAIHLYRRLVDAGRLWEFLKGVLGGASLKKAWEVVASPFCLETGYKLWASFIGSQSHIRAHLHRLRRPGHFITRVSEPARQLILHLQSAFRSSACPPAAFQAIFQQPFLAR
jgi:IS1 family transposase